MRPLSKIERNKRLIKKLRKRLKAIKPNMFSYGNKSVTYDELGNMCDDDKFVLYSKKLSHDRKGFGYINEIHSGKQLDIQSSLSNSIYFTANTLIRHTYMDNKFNLIKCREITTNTPYNSIAILKVVTLLKQISYLRMLISDNKHTIAIPVSQHGLVNRNGDLYNPKGQGYLNDEVDMIISVQPLIEKVDTKHNLTFKISKERKNPCSLSLNVDYEKMILESGSI